MTVARNAQEVSDYREGAALVSVLNVRGILTAEAVSRRCDAMRRCSTKWVAPMLAAVMVLGPGAGSAMADTPASDQYGGVAGGGAGGGVLGTEAGGTLPFTGANLLAFIGLGGGITAIGFAVRGLAGRKHPAPPR